MPDEFFRGVSVVAYGAKVVGLTFKQKPEFSGIPV